MLEGVAHRGSFVAVKNASLRPKLPDDKSYIFNVGTAVERMADSRFLALAIFPALEPRTFLILFRRRIREPVGPFIMTAEARKSIKQQF